MRQSKSSLCFQVSGNLLRHLSKKHDYTSSQPADTLHIWTTTVCRDFSRPQCKSSSTLYSLLQSTPQCPHDPPLLLHPPTTCSSLPLQLIGLRSAVRAEMTSCPQILQRLSDAARRTEDEQNFSTLEQIPVNVSLSRAYKDGTESLGGVGEHLPHENTTTTTSCEASRN